MKKVLAAPLAAVLTVAAAATAQNARVVVNGVPTNMRADWSLVATLPDPTQADTFYAFLPLDQLSWFAAWDPDTTMDGSFGAGNWLRCRLDAQAWAYLSPDACAHQPAPGAVAPQSLLTSNYDSGAYAGVAGAPQAPIPDATTFSGAPTSYVQGLGAASLSLERWQLRTRGFWLNELWNACPASANVTPNFTGWIAVRFRYQLL